MRCLPLIFMQLNPLALMIEKYLSRSVVKGALYSVVLMGLVGCVMDEKCLGELVGTYVGEESCPQSLNTVTLTIEKTSKEDEVRCTFVGTGIEFIGKLSYDCASIDVKEQNVAAVNGKIEGVFFWNGQEISGNIEYPTESCAYRLARR